MARSQKGERPVNDDEFESMPGRIRQHFDRVRDLLAETLDQESSGECVGIALRCGGTASFGLASEA